MDSRTDSCTTVAGPPAGPPAGLAALERDGFLLVPGALDDATVTEWKRTLYDLHRRGLNEIDNSVGNVAFESLLRLVPELAQGLIGHPSVAPYLKTILGKQCQLRSLRAHLNPRAYRQEWHMDFADYHYQERKALAARPLRALCMNTTFYLTDNTPERGRLTFLKNYVDRLLPEELLPHVYYTDDRSNPLPGVVRRAAAGAPLPVRRRRDRVPLPHPPPGGQVR